MGMNWQILTPEITLVEKIVRTFVVYTFLVLIFRWAGKRELGQLTPFDLVVLLIISNALQNALIGNDNSLGGGLLGALTLIGINRIFAWLSIRSPRFAHWVEGDATVLIDQGLVIDANLRREMMTRTELERALRKHELDPRTDLPKIKLALLETDGSVTVLHGGTDDDCVSS